ncbi:MAG: type I restriction enzyme HsdR N-terminal domain-containing protein [Chlamydiae bacterium]|nr:type I restriction enzyme HsdR N-terminal domain-containing protein [Chlamydiota bacterium]
MSSEQNKQEIFDSIRKKWVHCTPEEIVRQQLINHMVYELFYPKELIAIEKVLSSIPTVDPGNMQLPDRRVDLICFAKGIHPSYPLYPLLLVECKESILLKKEAQDQVIGYNYFIKAYFVAVAYPGGVEWGCYDRKKQEYLFFPSLPPYSRLIQAVTHARL